MSDGETNVEDFGEQPEASDEMTQAERDELMRQQAEGDEGQFRERLATEDDDLDTTAMKRDSDDEMPADDTI